ncbi:MAG: 4-hydroxy-tetrahydrodipicolinate reductase [Candidatus Merdivicinus sp.]|jgi:4-hydroxy-tetrahydrodipicolinate reductase
MVEIMLCGCQGKMGRVIAECVSARDDCRIVAGVDVHTEEKREFPVYANPADAAEKPDVIIDYSHPSSLDGLLAYSLAKHVPLVIATTGYNEEQIAKIEAASQEIPIFFSFNMSLGVNLLADLAKKAAQVLGGQFDIEIIEKHHNRKLDAPSGTALMLADAINETMGNQEVYVYDRHSVRKKREKNEIGIHSVRGGTIVGEHEVIFAGRDEVITLSHTAMSREIFAVGSLNAAVFMKDQKKAGLYRMADLIAE